VIWTDLTATDIAEEITQRGHPVSVHIVEQLLAEHDYRRRKAQKAVPLQGHKDRDEQFTTIARLTHEYLEGGLPVLSLDTKKRELLVPGRGIDPPREIAVSCLGPSSSSGRSIPRPGTSVLS
jgi:hypothetical protein